MKKLLAGGLIWLAALFSTPAHAGIPVIDVANLAQAIEQVMAWARQYQQMVQQYEQMVRQYESMTGSRNLGAILNNSALRDVVPADVLQVYNAVQFGGTSGLSAAARAIRTRAQLYDCEDREGEAQQRCQALLGQNAQTQAYAQNAMELVTARVDQIEALMNQINATEDPKAIAELQARLQVETAQVANDNNRIAVLNQMAIAQKEQAEQRIRESQMKNLSLTNDGTERFHYVPFQRR